MNITTNIYGISFPMFLFHLIKRSPYYIIDSSAVDHFKYD